MKFCYSSFATQARATEQRSGTSLLLSPSCLAASPSSCRSVQCLVTPGGRVTKRVTTVSGGCHEALSQEVWHLWQCWHTCCELHEGHARLDGRAPWLSRWELSGPEISCCLLKAFYESLLIDTREGGGRGQYEEGSVLSVARSSTADRAHVPCWHRHSSSSAGLRSAAAHKLHVLTVSPDRLC